jgi:hypothetical protein
VAVPEDRGSLDPGVQTSPQFTTRVPHTFVRPRRRGRAQVRVTAVPSTVWEIVCSSLALHCAAAGVIGVPRSVSASAATAKAAEGAAERGVHGRTHLVEGRAGLGQAGGDPTVALTDGADLGHRVFSLAAAEERGVPVEVGAAAVTAHAVDDMRDLRTPSKIGTRCGACANCAAVSTLSAVMPLRGVGCPGDAATARRETTVTPAAAGTGRMNARRGRAMSRGIGNSAGGPAECRATRRLTGGGRAADAVTGRRACPTAA